MERGVKTLVRILAGALLLGAVVVALHPDFRATFQAMMRGTPDEAPIWQSNEDYYSEVGYDDE